MRSHASASWELLFQPILLAVWAAPPWSHIPRNCSEQQLPDSVPSCHWLLLRRTHTNKQVPGEARKMWNTAAWMGCPKLATLQVVPSSDPSIWRCHQAQIVPVPPSNEEFFRGSHPLLFASSSNSIPTEWECPGIGWQGLKGSIHLQVRRILTLLQPGSQGNKAHGHILVPSPPDWWNLWEQGQMDLWHPGHFQVGHKAEVPHPRTLTLNISREQNCLKSQTQYSRRG